MSPKPEAETEAEGKAAAKSNRTPTLEDLQIKIDNLWEQHLCLLDQYDLAQKQIQKNFSSGFFSLAQATFKSPNKIRYGRDYYDERMRASRTVSVELDEEEKPLLSVRSERDKKAGGVIKEEEGDVVKEEIEKDNVGLEKEGLAQLPTPPATPLHLVDNDSDSETRDAEKVDQETAKTESKREQDHSPTDANPDTASSEQPEVPEAKKTRDPVNWYGILVPPQLRQSQASFTQAIEGPIGEAVTAAHGMKRVEVEIRRLRKEVRKAEKRGLIVEDRAEGRM